MREPEMIEITERVIDPRDLCQYDNPMSFCPVCGTYLHCKPDDQLEYRRREEKSELKHWFTLPLELRRRWWDETKYGKQEPSEELVKEIQKIIETNLPKE